MHGVDANIIIRYLTGDDPKQAEQARAVIGQMPVFIVRTVLLEVEWVLRGVYDMLPEGVVPARRASAGLPGVVVGDAGLVAKAMDWARRGWTLPMRWIRRLRGKCEGF